MEPSRVALVVAAIVVAACGRARPGTGTGATAEERAEQAIRARYASSDAVAAATYAWTSPLGIIFVLVDVESGVAGVVQARADLWMAGDTAPIRVGRSDVMPSAATIGAFAFEDVTGDGLPDLLGFVADSAGTAFPIFLAGARGAMSDAIEPAAAGWRLSAEPEEAPRVLTGKAGPCALQIWADAPAPDSLPSGWRYLALRASGELGAPVASPSACQ